MQNEPYLEDACQLTAPPTTPGALPPLVLPSKWPTVLGVIAIVLGVLGALGAVWGILNATALAGLIRTPAVPPEVLAQIERMRPWTITTSILTLPIALLLLAAGIGLCGRRRWSLAIARTWAVTKILLVLLTVGVSVTMMTNMLRSQPQATGPGPFETAIQGVSVIFGLAWGWALPVFMLIWLSRAKIKAETANWK